ncbi:hypothetical protein EON65_08825 [archaeon]|nr:MAG: hypothetical protein EON65_08825 [archaeon]
MYQQLPEYSFSEVVYHYQMAISNAEDENFNATVVINFIDFESRAVDANDKNRLKFWMELLEDILSRSPTNAIILTKLGQLYLFTENQLKAKELFEESLIYNPSHLLARIELANWHFRNFQWQTARENYLLAIEIASMVGSDTESEKYNFFVLYSNVAQTYREESKLISALQYMSLAQNYTVKSNEQATLSSILSMKYFSLQWRQLEVVEEQFIAFIIENKQGSLDKSRRKSRLDRDLLLDPYTNSLVRYTDATNDVYVNSEKCAESDIYIGDFNVLYSDARHETYYSSLTLSFAEESSSMHKLRIGYLSYDWRKHPMGLLTSYFVLNHTGVESYCISYGVNDMSDIRGFISSHCQYYVEANMVKNDKDVAEFIIANLHLDILIDLTSHTYNNRIGISNYKPAPIVVNYLGFAASTGCVKSFDYVVLDRYVAPVELQLAHVYTEKVVFLPYCYQANNMPIDIAPYFLSNRTALSIKHMYRKYGRTNVCMLNHVGKIEPLAFQTWMNLLHTHPHFDLLFLDVPQDSRASLYQHAMYHGVDTSRMQVLEKLPWRRHLYRISVVCDMALDTFVYGAHTTASDTTWMSIPLFSMRSFGLLGNRMPSRVASSILTNTLSNPYTRQVYGHGTSHLLLSDSVKQYQDSMYRHVQRNSMQKLQEILYQSTCWGHSMDKEQQRRSLIHSQEAMLDIYLMQRNASLAGRFMHNKVVLTGTARESKKFHLVMLPKDSGTISRNWCDEMIAKLYQYVVQKDYSALEQHLEFYQRSPPSVRAIQAVIHRYLASNISSNVQVDELISYISNSVFEDDSNFSALSVPQLLHNYHHVDNRSVLINDILMYLRYQNYSNNIIFGNFSNTLTLSMLSNMNKTIDILQDTIIALSRAPGVTDTELEHCAYDWLLIFITSLEQALAQLASLDNSSQDNIEDIYDRCRGSQNNLTMYSHRDYENMQPLDLLSFLHDNVTMCHIATLFSYPIQLMSSLPAKDAKSIATIVHHHRLITALLRSFNALSDSSNNNVNGVFTKPIMQLLSDVFFELSYISMGKRMKDPHRVVALQEADEYLHLHLSIALQYYVALTLSLLVTTPHSSPYIYTERQTSAIRGLSHTISLNRMVPINTTSMSAIDFGFIAESIATKLEFMRMQHEHIDVFAIAPSNQRPYSSSSLSIAIYCFEYSHAWWPGWGPKSFQSQLSPISNSTNQTGMGGSEEAVAHLAHALASLGYNVTIYSEISLEENNMLTSLYGGQEVRWLHYSLYPSLATNAFDVFISWRYAASLALSTKSARRSLLWLHDRVEYYSLAFSTLFHIAHGILVQSESHRQYTAKEIAKAVSYGQTDSAKYRHALEKTLTGVFIVPNGVYEDECAPEICRKDADTNLVSVTATPKQSVSPQRRLQSYAGPRPVPLNPAANPAGRNPWSFIYSSSPPRGLEPLLLIWPRILSAFPLAELHVYYGFSAAFRKQMTKKMGVDGYNAFEDKMMRLLNQTNVHYHGPVSHRELALAYHRAGFFLYPAIFAETGCIAMMKAMMYGAIPVTSRLVDTALEELGHGFDLGPGAFARNHSVNRLGWFTGKLTPTTSKFVSLTLPDLNVNDFMSRWLVEQYWPCLFKMLRADMQALHEHRFAMQQYAREHLTWISSAKRMQDVLNSSV